MGNVGPADAHSGANTAIGNESTNSAVTNQTATTLGPQPIR